MCTQCPECREWLKLAGYSPGTRLLCPFCQTIFPLVVQSPLRQLLVAVDVSRSSARFFPQMKRRLARLRSELRHTGPVNVCTYLFHRRVMPFQCEQWCRPCPEGRAAVPTLGDLRVHVGGGSAILDALYRLLSQVGSSAAVPSELVILTDGQDHGSHRHPAELRRKLEQVKALTSIRFLVFTKNLGGKQLLRCMQRLANLDILWSLYCQGNDSRLSTFPLNTKAAGASGNGKPTTISNPIKRG